MDLDDKNIQPICSPKPNPRDFKSYEDYLEALDIHYRFENLAKQATSALETSNTEIEYEQKMLELGFEVIQDDFCKNIYCEKNQECLFCSFEYMQNDYNKRFFGNLLSDSDKIFSIKDSNDYVKGSCPIPKRWFHNTTFESRVIAFILDLEDILIFENKKNIPFDELSKEEKVKDFCRNMYLFFQANLRTKNTKNIKKYKTKMMIFLNKNNVFHKEISEKFLDRLKEL